MAIFLKKHIFRFQISVNNTHMIEIQQHLQDLLDDFCNIVLWKLPTCDNLLEKFASLAKLNYQNIMGFVVIDFEESYNVDVI